MPFARVNSQFEPAVSLRRTERVVDPDGDGGAGRERAAERQVDRLVAHGRPDVAAVDPGDRDRHPAEPGGDRVQLEPIDRGRRTCSSPSSSSETRGTSASPTAEPDRRVGRSRVRSRLVRLTEPGTSPVAAGAADGPAPRSGTAATARPTTARSIRGRGRSGGTGGPRSGRPGSGSDADRDRWRRAVARRRELTGRVAVRALDRSPRARRQPEWRGGRAGRRSRPGSSGACA